MQKTEEKMDEMASDMEDDFLRLLQELQLEEPVNQVSQTGHKRGGFRFSGNERGGRVDCVLESVCTGAMDAVIKQVLEEADPATQKFVGSVRKKFDVQYVKRLRSVRRL